MLRKCEEKCWSVGCSDPINFKLIDKVSQQDVVFGNNPKYKLDSMQLNKQPDFKLGYHKNHLSAVIGDYHGLQTTTGISAIDTTYLRLRFDDIDTLIISYNYQSRECCAAYGGYGKIISIRYNGQTATKTGENYVFEK